MPPLMYFAGSFIPPKQGAKGYLGDEDRDQPPLEGASTGSLFLFMEAAPPPRSDSF